MTPHPIRSLAAIAGGSYIAVVAEEKFQQMMLAISLNVTPGHLEVMAEQGMRFREIVDQLELEPDELDRNNPGVRHLRSLGHEALMELLEEVIPEHTLVLKRHPQFALGLTEDLKSLVGG